MKRTEEEYKKMCREIVILYQSPDISVYEISKYYKIGLQTLYRILKEMGLRKQ